MTADEQWLRAWAAATDPADDPITPEEIRSIPAGTDPLRPPRPSSARRVLALAAVLVVIVGVTATALIVRRGDDGRRVHGDATTTLGTGPTPPTTGVLTVDHRGSGPTAADRTLGWTRALQGGDIVDEHLGWLLADPTPFRATLPTGTYVIRHTEAVCGDECELLQRDREFLPNSLFGGSDRWDCQGSVTVAPGAETAVTVRRSVDPNSGTLRCTIASGPSVRITAEATELTMGREGVQRRLTVTGPGGPVVEVPLPGDRALVFDGTLPPGRYRLAVEEYPCSAACPEMGPDGRPLGADPTPPPMCTVTADLGAERTVWSIRVTGRRCAVDTRPTLPELIVPPAWSLRPPLPRSCGSDQLYGLAPGLPNEPSRYARTCFAAVVDQRLPAEFRTYELGPGDRRSAVVLRTQDGRVERWTVGNRLLDWTRQTCTLAPAPDPTFFTLADCSPATPVPRTP